MEFRVNYMIVGLFVLILSSALVLSGFWITAGRYGKDFIYYAIDMDEPVGGLTVDSPVKYNGVRVGYVDKLYLHPENPQLTRVILEVVKGTPITESTVATLQSQGLTGVSYIGLDAKTPDAPLLKAKPGEPYPIIKSEPSLFAEIGGAVRHITVAIKNMSENISKAFDEDNQQALHDVLRNMNKITTSLAKNAQHLDSIVPDAAHLLKNTAAASDKLSGLLDSMDDASKQVSLTMQEGRGAMKQLSQQTLPMASKLMQTLNGVAVNLEQLSVELEHNPSILLRGKKTAAGGPGE